MEVIVQPGDSLWSIARRTCGDGLRWREIARANRLSGSEPLIVGQRLWIHEGMVPRIPQQAALGESSGFTGPPRMAGQDDALAPSYSVLAPAVIPSAHYVFVLADEVDPFRAKVVRRVLVNPKMAAEAAINLGRPLPLFPHPERYGFVPTGPDARVSLGRHALGLKPSPYSSASTGLMGARRFLGTPFWIDVEAARAAGATFHETSEILANLDVIASRAATPADRSKVEAIKALVAADREVLIKGPVPASAVKGPAAMTLTRSLQGVQVVSFAMSAVNLGHAAETSVRTQSVRPIAAEGVRQAGGWAAAWAGTKLGAAGGAMFGLETGPGAIAFAGVGGLVGGLAGYFGFDWIADHIDPN